MTVIYLFQNRIPTMITMTMPTIARSGIIAAMVINGIVLFDPVCDIEVGEVDTDTVVGEGDTDIAVVKVGGTDIAVEEGGTAQLRGYIGKEGQLEQQ